MTAPSDLGPWLRQQREHRSWTRNELARRLIRTALVTGVRRRSGDQERSL